MSYLAVQILKGMTLVDLIAEAVALYRQRYESDPVECLMHVSHLDDLALGNATLHDGIAYHGKPFITKGTVYVGFPDPAEENLKR